MPEWKSTNPFSGVKNEGTLQNLNEGARRAGELRNYYWPRGEFRKLFLGTARDSFGLQRVTLFGAEEIVMNDGYRSTDWKNLSADITLSGAGGLSSGAEAASTWYEIYAIQKSADDAKAIMLHKGRQLVLDEQATDGTTSSTLTTNTGKFAQGFQLDLTSPVFSIAAMLLKTGAPTGQVYATINTSSGGFPTTTVVAASDYIDIANLPASSSWIQFHFRSLPLLTVGTQYHLVLNTSSAALTGANFITWYRSNTDVYATRGAAASYNGTSWSAIATSDFTFQVLCQVDNVLVLPTGYNRYALIGYVYNNASSNFQIFWAKGREVATQVTSVVTLSISGSAVAIGVTNVVPPVPVMADFYISHTNAGHYVAVCPGDSPRVSTDTGVVLAYASVANIAAPQVPLVNVYCESQWLYGFISSAGGGINGALWSKGYRW
jgi:hypothetical protein